MDFIVQSDKKEIQHLNIKPDISEKTRERWAFMEIIGVDHGYAAMKTTHYVFPSGVVDYGEHEPYTLQNTLLYNGK